MAWKTEVRSICDQCGMQSPVLEDDSFKGHKLPKGWTEFVRKTKIAFTKEVPLQDYVAFDKLHFCCEAHKGQWVAEHAEPVLAP